MSLSIGDIALMASNVYLAYLVYKQRRALDSFRESIHAMIPDEGYVEGEAQMIVEELYRVSTNLKVDPGNPFEFAIKLLESDSFRRAVAHEELYRLYQQSLGKRT